MLSHTCMGVPYEYTHMGRPIRIWGRTGLLDGDTVEDLLQEPDLALTTAITKCRSSRRSGQEEPIN